MPPIGWTIIAWLVPLLAITTAGHALLNKKDSRAALGWIAVCLFFPVAGPILYYLFGINRIRTRAQELKRHLPFRLFMPERSAGASPEAGTQVPIPDRFLDILSISNTVAGRTLVGGNHLDMLVDGEQAYPAMLETITKAKRTCFLTTYIFDRDKTGRAFSEALGAAVDRGVDVRVIIDGVGEHYSFPRVGGLLRKKKIRFARFLPPRLLPPSLSVNLRNHRKILVADGLIGYTGGMNISDRHLTADIKRKKRVADVHFRLQGPIVKQMTQVFLEDWGFCTGERSVPEESVSEDYSDMLCRAVVDGPNEDLDKLAIILTGAIQTARKNILIMTPYFLPAREMISALQIAALRGVDITIILPARNNLPFLHWAARNMLWELLQYNIKIYYQPPPFAHTKLFIIDNQYVHIGSANLDPRSLRLNFEFAVEICNETFGRKLTHFFEEIQQKSTSVSLKDMDSRPLFFKIRDALIWIFSPYL
jgi:cardiolipin synthase